MPERLGATGRFTEQEGGFTRFIVIDITEDVYGDPIEIVIPLMNWNDLDVDLLMNEVYIRYIQDAGDKNIKKWRKASKRELAIAGWDTGKLRHEIVYGTLRQELMDRGVDLLTLNMPDVEKFIQIQSYGAPSAIHPDYIDTLARKLGQISQAPLMAGKILEDFVEQLNVDEEENKRIIGERLSGFENPRNLEEAKQFAEEKSRRIQELVANGWMSEADAVPYNNDIEREFEKQNQKFQGISRQMEVGRQGGMALANYFQTQPTRGRGESEQAYGQRRASFFGEAVTPEFRSQIQSGQFDPQRPGDLSQQMQWIAYQTEQRDLDRLREIEQTPPRMERRIVGWEDFAGTTEKITLSTGETWDSVVEQAGRRPIYEDVEIPYTGEPGEPEPEEPPPLAPVTPFRNLVREAQKNKQRRISI